MRHRTTVLSLGGGSRSESPGSLSFSMQSITSRKNRAVAHYRAAAAGDLDGRILLDGAHLVGEALASGIRIRDAVVAAESMDRAELRPLVEAIAGQGAEMFSASSAVMDALSPVRSPSAIVAIGD